MDDVLFDINPGILNHFNRLHGTNHRADQVKDFFLEKMLGLTKEEMQEFLMSFYDSSDHHNGDLIKGSKDGIGLIKKYDLILITARLESVRIPTEKWLQQHFPGAFSQTHLLGMYAGSHKKRSKGEVAKELGIQLFIDDSLTNALDIVSYGIPVILLDKLWNQAVLPPNVYRVHSWTEIVDTVEELVRINIEHASLKS